MEKYIKDGKVGVLVSPGYGAGWSTWGDDGLRDQLAMDSRFVQAKLDGWNKHELEGLVGGVFGEDTHVCLLGWHQTVVEWVPAGEKFEITEYDGYESLELMDFLSMTA